MLGHLKRRGDAFVVELQGCIQIEHDAQQQGQGNGKVDVGVVGLKRACQLGRVGHGSTHNEVAESSGRTPLLPN